MRIMEDTRTVKSITLEDGSYSVGAGDNVTAIIPYEECGEMAHVIWFKILRGETIVTRVSGKYVVEIVY